MSSEPAAPARRALVLDWWRSVRPGSRGGRSRPLKPQLPSVWTSKSVMPTPRWELAVVSAPDGKIYALGGTPTYNGEERVGTVEAYDPSTGEWPSRGSLHPRVDFGAAVAANGKVYLAGGGWGRVWEFATFEEYDPSTNRSRLTADMPPARAGLALVATPNGKLLAKQKGTGRSQRSSIAGGTSRGRGCSPRGRDWIRDGGRRETHRASVRRRSPEPGRAFGGRRCGFSDRRPRGIDNRLADEPGGTASWCIGHCCAATVDWASLPTVGAGRPGNGSRNLRALDRGGHLVFQEHVLVVLA